MTLLNTYHRLPLDQISILRDTRQRRSIDTSSIDASILSLGVIQPIVVRPRIELDPPGTQPGTPWILVAGERRFTSSLKNGLPDIPVRFAAELTPNEASIIELEENVKREDLHWKDQVRAVGRLHEVYCSLNPNWCQADSARRLSINSSYMSVLCRVYRDMDSPRLNQAGGIQPAFNILERLDHRRMADVLSDISEATVELGDKLDQAITPNDVETIIDTAILQEHSIQQQQEIPSSSPTAPLSKILPAEQSILLQNFLIWADTYTGPRFNLLHCDFPFGIEVFAGAQSGRDAWETYRDEADIYWQLLECLAMNLDKLITPSAHMLFWFSMEHYETTLKVFDQLMPSWEVQKFPLVWFKSDNVGILPDPKRGPRRVYETALLASRGDRFILKPVSNVYPAPTDKRHHPSTKPEPVLKHFFSMLVDENTKLLDPTCGSGSALRAAEALGATHVLGLEANAEHCENGRKALRSFRVLRGG